VVKKLTPRLVTSLDRAVALATQTLRYGRAQERPPARKRIALKPVIDEAAETALGTRESVNPIALRNRANDALQIDADPEQLFRIVLNLLRNAVEALANSEDGAIEIVAERHGRTVSFSIVDNGPGIAAALQGKLFQPFAAPMRAGGTGLGLAIARDLARLHGGELTLLSTGPDGTSFRIDIPDRDVG
jgi:signal transduction histidine kinase